MEAPKLRVYPRGPACDLDYQQDLAREILLTLIGRRDFDHYRLATAAEQKKLVELSVQLAHEFLVQSAG